MTVKQPCVGCEPMRTSFSWTLTTSELSVVPPVATGFDVGTNRQSRGPGPRRPYADQSCAVQAVIDLYGPIADTPKWNATLVAQDGPQAAQLNKQVTPLSHIDASDPPVLIMHGTADTTVAVRDSEVMHAALAKISPKHQLVIVPGAPHTFHLQPKQQDLRPIVLEFLGKHLTKN